MKYLLVAFLLVSQFSFAEENETANSQVQNGPNFEQNKTEALSAIDKRIASLQEMKTCISGSSDRSSLKACHEKHREAMQSMRLENMEERHEKKMDRMRNRMKK